MKKILIILLSYLFCIYHSSFAQNPLVKKWDSRFGGLAKELLNSIEQTSDGGYILGGYTKSDISGDVSQPNHALTGFSDYWILKTYSLGNTPGIYIIELEIHGKMFGKTIIEK